MSQAIDAAIILAGGLGTRLRPALPAMPKVLAPVAGRPFLACLLDQVVKLGVRRAMLCTGYMADSVAAAIGPRYGALEIVYSREDEPLGTGGALRRAAHRIEAETVLALNGDSYCGLDLDALLALRVANPGAAVVALAALEDTRGYGRVETDDTGRIVAFREKDDVSGPGLVNAGVYLMDAAALRALPDRRPLSLEREIFPAWADGRLYGCVAPGPFVDIGLPARYKIAAEILGKKDRGG